MFDVQPTKFFKEILVLKEVLNLAFSILIYDTRLLVLKQSV